MKTILTLILIAGSATAQIQGPITVRHIEDRAFALHQNAGDFAEQWIAAFAGLKVTPGYNIEIVTSKDDNILTLDNIYALKTPPVSLASDGTKIGNLLIAVQRIDGRDYFVILDPRQIRYIRQIKAD